ncbi:MAG: molybdopterin-dependent oxidoreductase [Promethearchaeota archaeon]
MRRKRLITLGAVITFLVIGSIIGLNIFLSTNNTSKTNLTDFPDFYTKTEDYYITRINDIPIIDEQNYKLEITGCIENPTNYSLSELRALPLIQFPLTIECIGNPTLGSLISTANWTGFSIYNLLNSLGIMSNATGVKYYAADGYYATHTMQQLMNNSVIGALYMNNQILPRVQGFPLRIINPGYYGAKQPAWVIGIEVIDMPLSDYWDDRGWDTSPPMAVDSKIFFPESYTSIKKGNSFLIGGAAYGGTRVSKVEYTLNDELDWHQANIVKSVDFDNVWVFWQIELTTSKMSTGLNTLYVRATDIYNGTQPKTDMIKTDGDNSWPYLVFILT